jgi:hypothetical protein
MPPVREILKRSMPTFVRDALIGVRDKFSAPPLEDIVIHDYAFTPDAETRPRLSLVIPSVSPKSAFGGVTTGIDIFLEIGKRTGVDLRILLDDFEDTVDNSIVEKYARSAGLDFSRIEIVPRATWVPDVAVRANDVFVTYNWWATLNIRSLLREQARAFGGDVKPHLYIIQEYEPLFYRMSSTHMMACAAFNPKWSSWGIFNSNELHTYFSMQGHRLHREYVFEPKLSNSMRPFLNGAAPSKERRILVYGRPTAPRNCFPAIVKGLREWARLYPEFGEWEVLSVGLPHPEVEFGPSRTMKSLGKLSLENYAGLLRTSAVGLSLMSSPHPSYPPLEMAHFGLRTVTNSYANKDLSGSHPNILSIDDVTPGTIADALARACRAFEADPSAAWSARSHRLSFLETGPFPFLDEIAADLMHDVWHMPVSPRP